jgi:hypothetical protein
MHHIRDAIDETPKHIKTEACSQSGIVYQSRRQTPWHHRVPLL